MRELQKLDHEGCRVGDDENVAFAARNLAGDLSFPLNGLEPESTSPVPTGEINWPVRQTAKQFAHTQ